MDCDYSRRLVQAQIKEDIAAKVTTDEAYKNAKRIRPTPRVLSTIMDGT